jgi:hypothetical protein
MLKIYCNSFNSQIKYFRIYVVMDDFLVLVRGTFVQNVSPSFSYTLYGVEIGVGY